MAPCLRVPGLGEHVTAASQNEVPRIAVLCRGWQNFREKSQWKGQKPSVAVTGSPAPSFQSTTTTMRFNAGCFTVLFTLVHCLVVNANTHEFDFHVSNLEVNGVRRTVVNGQSPFSRLSSGQYTNVRVVC